MASLHLSPVKLLPTSPPLPLPITFPPTTIPSLGRTRNTNLLNVSASPAGQQGDHGKGQKLSHVIEEKVTEAQKICQGNGISEECVVAWDEVEEVSQAKAHLRQRSAVDPFEGYCRDHPDAPECRLYGD